MPCNSDHLEPSQRERELQNAAQLYIYVLEQMKKPVPVKVRRAAQDAYCNDDGPYIKLCSTLRSLDGEEFERIVYDNARDPRARRLADWWEQHQKDDAARKKRELADVVNKLEHHRRYVVCVSPGFFAKYSGDKPWTHFTSVMRVREATPLHLDFALEAVKHAGPNACVLRLDITIQMTLHE